MQNMAAVYAKQNEQNMVIFCYTPSGSTTNSEAIVYDRQRLGWLPKWSGITANCFTVYKGSDGVRHVLYGDDTSGYVKEILTGTTDFDASINAFFELKSDSFKSGINHYKRLKLVDVVTRNQTGSVTLKIIKDGTETESTVNLTRVQPSINFGHYVLSEFLLGESYGIGSVTASDEMLLKTIRTTDVEEGRSFGLRFENNQSGKFTLLSVSLRAKPKSETYRRPEDYSS
jgi:hypothetical protein